MVIAANNPLAEGFGAHVPKGYIHEAMMFSALIEGLNMMRRRAQRKRTYPYGEDARPGKTP